MTDRLSAVTVKAHIDGGYSIEQTFEADDGTATTYGSWQQHLPSVTVTADERGVGIEYQSSDEDSPQEIKDAVREMMSR